MSLKLVDLNIQRDKNFERVRSFLGHSGAGVVCLQEVFEEHLQQLAGSIGAKEYRFAPMTRYHGSDEVPHTLGVAIFSRHSVIDSQTIYYTGDASHLPELHQADDATWNNKNFPLLCADITVDGVSYRIMTAHHTWTPDGKPTDMQRMHTTLMLHELSGLGEFILTGDFNAPRGGEIFDRIASLYKDNVPEHYASSLDEKLHRVPGLRLMVDGLFSTPAYTVEDTHMLCGISDHCALVATVSKQ